MTADVCHVIPERPPRMTQQQMQAACALSCAIFDDSTISVARAESTRDELWRLLAAMHHPDRYPRYQPTLDFCTSFILCAGRHGLMTPRQVAAAIAAGDSDAA